MTFNGYDMLSYYDQLDSNGQETVQTLQSNAQETIEDLQTEITDYLCESVQHTTIEKFVKLDQ
jgi:flagellar biosynthesis protein FliP